MDMEKDPHLSLGLFFCFAFWCGLAGELFRAEKAGLPFRQLLFRAGMRCFASSGTGMACGLIFISKWPGQQMLCLGTAGLLALLGAEVVGALYETVLKKRAGL